jgi:mono/diheme cytochrome c family protein
MNWMLHCQGCHLSNGAGTAAGAPSMVGEVARFLEVEGGREYLTRVPGVANAGIPDDQLAELLNWTLSTFDRADLPEGFEPFSEEEIAAGRVKPFVSEAGVIRAKLVSQLSDKPEAAVADEETGVD